LHAILKGYIFVSLINQTPITGAKTFTMSTTIEIAITHKRELSAAVAQVRVDRAFKNTITVKNAETMGWLISQLPGGAYSAFHANRAILNEDNSNVVAKSKASVLRRIFHIENI
jgi:hypothetical protein